MPMSITGALRGARWLRAVTSLALASSLMWQPAQAARRDDALNACATERAPLVALDKQYRDMKRSKLGEAVGEGIKKGAAVIATGVMNGGLLRGGGGGGFGGLGGLGGFSSLAGSLVSAGVAQQAQAQAAANGAPAPAAAPAMFGPDLLSGAMGLNVPGVSGGSFGVGGGDNMKAYAALAVLVAIVGTIEAYAQLKEQEAGGDLQKASFNIDQDAARQLAVTRDMASSAGALADCRTKQLADLNSRLAGASNDKDRRAIAKERTQYVGALKQDIDLTGGLAEEHAGMAKTFTQGRAMTGGISEAEVLGPQAPAYESTASTEKLAMPARTQQASYAPQQQAAPPPPPPASPMVTVRTTALRAAPVASADVVMSVPAGRDVQPKTAEPQGGWFEIDISGKSGYVRAADLGPPGSAPVQVASAGKGGKSGKGKAKAAAAAAPPPRQPPAPPQLAAASNIRAYNEQVIAVRDTGKGRLSMLMTDIQTSMKRPPTIWASLTSWFG